MGAGYESVPLPLSLVGGQVQRVLVEAGSSVVVVDGALTVRFPFAWLAERCMAQQLQVTAEQVYRFDEGGWVELVAHAAVEVVILPPEGRRRWQRLLRILSLAREGQRGCRGDVVAGV